MGSPRPGKVAIEVVKRFLCDGDACWATAWLYREYGGGYPLGGYPLVGGGYPLVGPYMCVYVCVCVFDWFPHP